MKIKVYANIYVNALTLSTIGATKGPSKDEMGREESSVICFNTKKAAMGIYEQAVMDGRRREFLAVAVPVTIDLTEDQLASHT